MHKNCFWPPDPAGLAGEGHAPTLFPPLDAFGLSIWASLALRFLHPHFRIPYQKIMATPLVVWNRRQHCDHHSEPVQEQQKLYQAERDNWRDWK